MSANELIKILNEEILGTVQTRIAEHRRHFEARSEAERRDLPLAARLAAIVQRVGEESVQCPACENKGTLFGTKVKEFPERYEDEELVMDVQYLATGFKCPSCGFVLKGVEEIAHAGLKTHFLEAMTTSFHELYEPEHYQEYDNM